MFGGEDCRVKNDAQRLTVKHFINGSRICQSEMMLTVFGMSIESVSDNIGNIGSFQ